jgi:hypothetical protein
MCQISGFNMWTEEERRRRFATEIAEDTERRGESMNESTTEKNIDTLPEFSFIEIQLEPHVEDAKEIEKAKAVLHLRELVMAQVRSYLKNVCSAQAIQRLSP